MYFIYVCPGTRLGIQQSRSREPITRNGSRTRHFPPIDSNPFLARPKISSLRIYAYSNSVLLDPADIEKLKKEEKKEEKRNGGDGGEGTIRKVRRCARFLFGREA